MSGHGLRTLIFLVAVGALGACSKSTATTPDCNNHIKDGSETDIDCGGSMCMACNSDMRCKVDHDCLSLLCNSDGKCSAPSCSDGILNGSESDVDCGGPDCDPCASGKFCFGKNDCAPASQCSVDGGVCE